MKLIWTVLALFIIIMGIEQAFAQECTSMNITKNIVCNEKFRDQSVKIFSVIDSSIGIISDPKTQLPLVDLGTFYGIGGNGTIPDKIEVFRDNVLWKTTTKETGIAPSTSHSEWQIPQTFFYNELPGKYKLRLITNNTETLVFEFIVKQITEDYVKDRLEINRKNNSSDNNMVDSKIPPLKQIKNGISVKNIACKENMKLVFKNSDSSPACVKQTTVHKLMEWGWIKP